MTMLVSNYPNVSINTANPPTEMARRDALRRDLFEPVKELEKSSAEKPLVSDEKVRSANGSQTQVNLYDANGKETETQQAVEGRGDESAEQQDAEREQQDAKQQQAEQQQAEQQEQAEVRELKARDQEVKTHEQAHAAVGGRYAGAPSYSYELGPDGKQYAVGGEVSIDISPVAGDPQATVQKMQQVRAAALAPAEPSSADRRIASEAAQRQIQAQAELVQQTSAPAQTKPADAKSVDTEATDTADSESGRAGFAEQVQQTEISYRVSDDSGSNAIVYPQRDTLAISAQMQLRRDVIAGFYQRATEPQIKQSLQQA
ncbi:putative metalloprotease CJM1_0395 family protein [Rheinheimera sp.]|uniref:putative metalloprotease CJM1_0395 family protein n=1 Tax=Rheinheimera sp. TaxID=1869214 RepID=UPI002736DDD1|nr:putative metalloprotease CJM1_0395 family protein [Rheinheimera sp.]MDP2714227.1 putative metalloprotease CJM1_0395 family protein [Rheinheimera sp.]